MARKYDKKNCDRLFKFTSYADRNLILDIQTVEAEVAWRMRSEMFYVLCYTYT